MTDRIPCCIPFCRRTAARDKHPNCTEIICGRCWREGIPKAARMVYSRAYRTATRVGERYEAARLSMERAPTPRDRRIVEEWHAAWTARDRAFERCRRLWSACKRRAVEAAAGLA